jgi:nucleoside 2-deoxyribosyltransferase
VSAKADNPSHHAREEEGTRREGVRVGGVVALEVGLPQRGLDGRREGFESPQGKKSAAQVLLFSETLKDATIAADITLRKSLGQRYQGQAASEANVIFRYGAEDQHYYAGTGAWGTKFHISKAIPGPTWLRLASVGSAEALETGRTFRFRVECQGSRLLLLENDTKVLEVFDDDYGAGRWGLSAWKTQARFETRPPERSPLQCFVAMPFAKELDGVFDLIEAVVESYENIECTRADQLSVSRPIMEDVRNQIARADLVIVDLTGRNSNVYYEAGMAAAWKKNWIVIAQSQDDLTFDVAQIRSIIYTNRMGGSADLESRLRRAIEETMGLARVVARAPRAAARARRP